MSMQQQTRNQLQQQHQQQQQHDASTATACSYKSMVINVECTSTPKKKSHLVRSSTRKHVAKRLTSTATHTVERQEERAAPHALKRTKLRFPVTSTVANLGELLRERFAARSTPQQAEVELINDTFKIQQKRQCHESTGKLKRLKKKLLVRCGLASNRVGERFEAEPVSVIKRTNKCCRRYPLTLADKLSSTTTSSAASSTTTTSSSATATTTTTAYAHYVNVRVEDLTRLQLDININSRIANSHSYDVWIL